MGTCFPVDSRSDGAEGDYSEEPHLFLHEGGGGGQYYCVYYSYEIFRI